ncbi:MAG: RNA pyrophosphohydrolase [Chlamydiia bacterium]|nr:RNA pyrophosphohydrolase [Chlamydiia bacterium]
MFKKHQNLYTLFKTPKEKRSLMKGESVSAIIYNSSLDQILLAKRRDVPVWTLIGGGIEEGETPQEAILREIQEETGDPTILSRCQLVRKAALYKPSISLTRTTHFYQCIVDSIPSRSSEECLELQFFPITNLPKEIPHFYLDWINDCEKGYLFTLEKYQDQISYWSVISHLFKHPIYTLRFFLGRLGVPINSN